MILNYRSREINKKLWTFHTSVQLKQSDLKGTVLYGYEFRVGEMEKGKILREMPEITRSLIKSVDNQGKTHVATTIMVLKLQYNVKIWYNILFHICISLVAVY